EHHRARRVVATFDVAMREIPIDLDADRRQVRFALDGQAGIGPRAEPALQDPDIAPSLLPQEPRDLSTRPFLRTRAQRDDELLLRVDLEVDRSGTDLIGVQADRLRYRERARLVVRVDAHVEHGRVESLLDEVDDLARMDAKAVAQPSTACQGAPGAAAQQ